MTVENGRVSWGDAQLVMNPWDEFAVEAALLQKEALGGDVTVISIGKEEAKEALKTALAMGCNEAVLVSDPALANGDSLAIAQTLAAAIKKIGGVEMAFFGRQAIDGDMGVTSVMTARLLGWPMISLAASIKVNAGSVRVERSIEEGRQVVEGNLPVVLSASKDIGEPRYPSFMGIRKASKANIPVWKLADLGISSVPQSIIRWPSVAEAPVREVVTEMIIGGSAQEIAEKLADKILAEKVL
jgi:electron transfer flavoprotein beta subunit